MPNDWRTPFLQGVCVTSAVLLSMSLLTGLAKRCECKPSTAAPAMSCPCESEPSPIPEPPIEPESFGAASTVIDGTVKEWFRVDSQRSLPICAASAVAAAMECVYWNATKQRFDVSSQAVWIAGKRANPACGCRTGCHHYNCIFGVSQWGAASATEWPQPWTCRDRVPPDSDPIWTKPKRMRITAHRNVSTYAEALAVIDKGGAVVTSVDINASLRARLVEDYKPGGLPHAWALVCRVNLQDGSDRPYLWGVDPQGPQQCRDVSPKSVDAMLALDGYGVAIEAVEVIQ